MLERGLRATDLQAPERRGAGSPEASTALPEAGVGTFPLFSEPPFVSWYLRHRREDYLQLYPGSLPRILLWDEPDGPVRAPTPA